jgi:hypothetical protein
MAEQSDQEFVEVLRASVSGYLQAVDRWEAAYNRYYRLSGYAHSLSSDMASEQRGFEARRHALESLLPRTGQLCQKYGMANPFPGLLRSSLGQYMPQERIESAISRNERNAVVECLENLNNACSGYAPAVPPEASTSEVRASKPPAPGIRRGQAVLAVIVCAILAISLAVRWTPAQWPSFGTRPGSARDIDEQPYGRRSGAEQRESWEAERRREAAHFTDADLRRMVDRVFIEDDPGRVNFHGLLYAGARPLPFLLKALDDPRTAATVFSKTGFDPIETSPFGRICALLDGSGPSEATAPLARYLDHPDRRFRQEAASLLARIGCVECLEPVKKALADSNREVRQFALIGLMRGLEDGQRNEKFLAGVFPSLTPLLNAGQYDTEGPATVMMAADATKAAPILESPRYFVARNPQLYDILTALDREDVKVPRETLLPLLAKLEPLAVKDSSGELTYAAALVLYANNPDHHAERRFRTLIDSSSSVIASTGARGLEILAGINPHEAIFDAYDKRGFAAMNKAQQLCFAVELYRDEVNNGGHNQYFYNDDSDLYQTAVEGLRAMGATSKAAVLSDAALAFAPEHPAPTERARRHQMDTFGPAQSQIFEMADRRFYHSEEAPGERLDVLEALYALQHRGDFGGTLSPGIGRGSHVIGARKR